MKTKSLPDQRAKAPESLKDQRLSFRLRPSVVTVGSLFFVGGWGVVIFNGAGLLPVVAIILGGLTLLARGLLRRSQEPLDAFDGPVSPQSRRVEELKKYIGKTRYLENVGDLGEKAADQLQRISERYRKFEELLPLKFDPVEVTYNRYHSAAEQTYLAILDQLNGIAAILNTLSAMEEDTGVQERKSLPERQVTRIGELFDFNESAILEFDRISVILSETQTRRGESDLGLEAALAQLAELAARAKKYGITS